MILPDFMKLPCVLFSPIMKNMVYTPPLINLNSKKFLPPIMFGKTILEDSTIIGGAFVTGLGKKGVIGSIFLDTPYQHKDYGKQAMLMIEEMHPNVINWKLYVLAENYGLHTFYQSLGSFTSL